MVRGGVIEKIKEALKALPSVPGMDDARYMDAHLAFRDASNQQTLMLEWLGGHVGRHHKGAESLSVLSVGCGTGILDQHLVEQMHTHAPEGVVDYVGCDPNPLEIERFRAAFGPLCGPQLSLDLHTCKLEDFSTDKRFGLIHIIHTLYYLPDLEGALRKSIDLLAPGGHLLIFNAPQGVIAQMTAAFSDRVWQRQQNFSEQVQSTLNKIQVPFQLEPIVADLDLTPCFTPGNPVGQLLVDFIAHGDTRALAPELRGLLLEYLRSTTQAKDGRHIAPHPVDVFVIAKPE